MNIYIYIYAVYDLLEVRRIRCPSCSTGGRLQPICARGCSPICERLQPYAVQVRTALELLQEQKGAPQYSPKEYRALEATLNDTSRQMHRLQAQPNPNPNPNPEPNSNLP